MPIYQKVMVMRKITQHELRSVELILDKIRTVIDLEYFYDDEQNILAIGDNYIMRGGTITQYNGAVEQDIFRLIYGEDHPGDDHFDFSRWEEEDVASANAVEPLLPIFLANLFQRWGEELIYSKFKLGLKG